VQVLTGKEGLLGELSNIKVDLTLSQVTTIFDTLLIPSLFSVLISKVHQVLLEFQLHPLTKKIVYVSWRSVMHSELEASVGIGDVRTTSATD